MGKRKSGEGLDNSHHTSSSPHHHHHGVVKEKPVYQWAEEAYKIERDGTHKYKHLHAISKNINDEGVEITTTTLFSIGDTVYVHSGTKVPFIGQIVDFSAADNDGNDKSVVFKWYYKISDLEKSFFTKNKVKPIGNNEIFLSDDQDMNSVISIISHCKVKYVLPFDNQTVQSLNMVEDEHLCRYYFGLKTKKATERSLIPLTEEQCIELKKSQHYQKPQETVQPTQVTESKIATNSVSDVNVNSPEATISSKSNISASNFAELDDVDTPLQKGLVSEEAKSVFALMFQEDGMKQVEFELPLSESALVDNYKLMEEEIITDDEKSPSNKEVSKPGLKRPTEVQEHEHDDDYSVAEANKRVKMSTSEMENVVNEPEQPIETQLVKIEEVSVQQNEVVSTEMTLDNKNQPTEEVEELHTELIDTPEDTVATTMETDTSSEENYDITNEAGGVDTELEDNPSNASADEESERGDAIQPSLDKFDSVASVISTISVVSNEDGRIDDIRSLTLSSQASEILDNKSDSDSTSTENEYDTNQAMLNNVRPPSPTFSQFEDAKIENGNYMDYLFTVEEIAIKFPNQGADLDYGCLYMCQMQSQKMNKKQFKTRLELNAALMSNWRRTSYKQRESYAERALQQLEKSGFDISMYERKRDGEDIDESQLDKSTDYRSFKPVFEYAQRYLTSNLPKSRGGGGGGNGGDKQPEVFEIRVGDDYQIFIPPYGEDTSQLDSSDRMMWSAATSTPENIDDYLSYCRTIIRNRMHVAQRKYDYHYVKSRQDQLNIAQSDIDEKKQEWRGGPLLNGLFIFPSSDFECNVLDILSSENGKIAEAVKKVESILDNHIHIWSLDDQLLMCKAHKKHPKHLNKYLTAVPFMSRRQLFEYAERFLVSACIMEEHAIPVDDEMLKESKSSSNMQQQQATSQSLKNKEKSPDKNINHNSRTVAPEMTKLLQSCQKSMDNFTLSQLSNMFSLYHQKIITSGELLVRIKYLQHAYLQYRSDTKFKFTSCQPVERLLEDMLDFYPRPISAWLRSIGYHKLAKEYKLPSFPLLKKPSEPTPAASS